MANELEAMAHDLKHMAHIRRTLLGEGRGPSIRLTAEDCRRFDIAPYEGSLMGMICEREVPSLMTPREKFCTLLVNSPLLYADAVIFLCGEDTTPRLNMLAEIMRTGGAGHVVLTGALHTPPRRHGAGELMADVMAKGVSFDRMTIESEAMHTAEQAAKIVPMAVERGWKRIQLLVPSYHQYRAYLTFVHALTKHGQTENIHLVNAPASHVPWFEMPEGMDHTRLELLEIELMKIDEYHLKQHVASYSDGVKYLKFWAGK